MPWVFSIPCNHREFLPGFSDPWFSCQCLVLTSLSSSWSAAACLARIPSSRSMENMEMLAAGSCVCGTPGTGSEGWELELRDSCARTFLRKFCQGNVDPLPSGAGRCWKNPLCSGSALKVLQGTSAWSSPCIPPPWMGGTWYSHFSCFPKGMELSLLPQAPLPPQQLHSLAFLCPGLCPGCGAASSLLIYGWPNDGKHSFNGHIGKQF